MINREKRFYEIVDGLGDYHYSFQRFAKLGHINWTETAETAEIRLYSNKMMEFAWNPDFFDRSDNYTNSFIFLHETLHIILDHFTRSKELDREITNIAADISINHMLVEEFGFNRDLIQDWSNLCWRDTVVKNKTLPVCDSFEGYYELLIKEKGNLNHLKVSPLPQFAPSDAIGNLSEVLGDVLAGGATLERGAEITKIERGKFKIKKDSLANLLQHIVASKIGKSCKEEDFWGVENRRYPSIGLPVQRNREIKKKKRKTIFIYADVSGSCSGVFREFIKFANSLDKQEYHVRTFAFDTSVSEIINGVLTHGGGGTNFDCVTDHAENKEYDSVFVLTDGEAKEPKLVKRYRDWFWFITDHGSKDAVKNYRNVYEMKDYICS